MGIRAKSAVYENSNNNIECIRLKDGRKYHTCSVGFHTGEKFEFGTFNDKSGLLGLKSKSLGYSEGYGDMGGLGKVKIGYEPFVHAVREIAKGQDTVKVNAWKKQIQGCLGTVSVMLCEGARFHPLFYTCDRLMRGFSSMRVAPWMRGHINGWEDISDVALNGEMSGEDDRKPPTTEDHVYGDADTAMAFIHKDWAMHFIAVNHQPDALPNFPTVSYQNFHLVIVGDRGTGKTSFVKTCLSREFLNNEESTKGVEYHILDFSTTRGRLRIYCWEVEDNEKFGALRDRCYKQCDFAIIMFDVTKRSTYDNVLKWDAELRRVNTNIQIVICGNKVDFKKKREVKLHQVTFPRLNKPRYFETSAKSSLNLEEPFLYLAKKFTRDDLLEFRELPPEGCLSLKFPELQCTQSGLRMAVIHATIKHDFDENNAIVDDADLNSIQEIIVFAYDL
ncbi:GTP-binding nuclear protein Ran-3 [Artemisia annua]|uniref:GTP-binding nuclear protein Ran-3 n=1 Tax=Artemisia annua TaxID=35608 RepID=A0A2U1N4H7_ARTAN|nr:GTP-binding nuclear protein Ran-3 [Artemisia annua]